MSFSRFALKIGVFISTLSLILLGTIVTAHSTITIDPPNPTDEECIRITVSVELPSSCYKAVYTFWGLNGPDTSIPVSDSTCYNAAYTFWDTFVFCIDIYYDLPPGMACAHAVYERDIIEELNPLPAGNYYVMAFVNNIDMGHYYEKTAIFQVSPKGDRILNDPNNDGLVSGSDVLFLSQSYLGGRGNLPPTIDLDGDGQVGGIDVLFSSQNYLGARPDFRSPKIDPVEFVFDPGTPTSAAPGDTITLTVNVSNKVNPSQNAKDKFGNSAISVDGLPITFIITSDLSGQSYLGCVAGTTSQQVLVAADPTNPGIGQAKTQLTLGTSETVVEARYNITNPNGKILKTISTEIVITPSAP